VGAADAALDAETPLMEAGLDSLAATELVVAAALTDGRGPLADARLRAADGARRRYAPARAGGGPGAPGSETKTHGYRIAFTCPRRTWPDCAHQSEKLADSGRGNKCCAHPLHHAARASF